MQTKLLRQGSSRLQSLQDDHVKTWVDRFMIDRRAQNMTAGTLQYYSVKMRLFAGYCDQQMIDRISQITSDNLREFLFWLENTGHNPGGIHAAFRAVKTFLRWYWDEEEPGTRNPIDRLHAPKVAEEPLSPASQEAIAALLEVCKGNGFLELRDRAIIMVLADSGVRAAELLAMNIDDFDQANGSILIRMGKGRKSRTVFLGQHARRALRKYLHKRQDENDAVWVTQDGNRLSYPGLAHMIPRRAAQAGIESPTLHSFRRAFALACLRAGMDIYSLKNLMGHSGLSVLQRYLKQNKEDLQEAHRAASPVDRMK